MLVEDLQRQFELFQDLDEVSLRKLLQFGRLKYFEDGTIIFRQGDLGAGLLCVLEGALDLFTQKGDPDITDSDNIAVVDQIGVGEFVGETTLFGEVRKRPTGARASGNTFVLWINTLEYRRLQSSGPMELTKVLLRLVINLSSTFRTKNQELGELRKKLEELEVFRNKE